MQREKETERERETLEDIILNEMSPLNSSCQYLENPEEEESGEVRKVE